MDSLLVVGILASLNAFLIFLILLSIILLFSSTNKLFSATLIPISGVIPWPSIGLIVKLFLIKFLLKTKIVLLISGNFSSDTFLLYSMFKLLNYNFTE